jgi:basic membrane lipoprotein Med (substrate-binding protein (PBP1-ABC) superfamily)
MTSLPRVSFLRSAGGGERPAPRRASIGAGRGSPRGPLAAAAVIVIAALAVISAVAGASAVQPDDGRQRVAVVVGAGQDPAAVAAAERAVRAAERAGADVDLRLPQSTGEQLGTTHLLAARGYDLVIGAGLAREQAVAPVAARYPQTRFALAEPDAIGPALARAVR